MDERPDDLELARLILAHQRRLGASFEQAWSHTLAALPATGGRNPSDRDRTVAALAATRLDWQLAYEGRPPRPGPGSASEVAKRLAAIAA